MFYAPSKGGVALPISLVIPAWSIWFNRCISGALLGHRIQFLSGVLRSLGLLSSCLVGCLPLRVSLSLPPDCSVLIFCHVRLHFNVCRTHYIRTTRTVAYTCKSLSLFRNIPLGQMSLCACVTVTSSYCPGEHRHYRPGTPVPTVPFCRLPHLSAWHLPFRVAQGGWVVVWRPRDALETGFEYRWVSQNSVWSPRSCQFVRSGAPARDERWIPTAWVDDKQCHFVRQSDVGYACVLKVPTKASGVMHCELYPDTPGRDCTAPDWRLRSDLQTRSGSMHQLRDGDVLVPATAPRRSAGGRAVTSIVVGLALCLRSGFFCAALYLGLLWPTPATGMYTADAAREVLRPAAVGKYAWQVPEQLRLCDAAVHAGQAVALLSPFTGCTEPVPADPDHSIDDLRVHLTGCEPAWTHHIMPVWPSIQHEVLTFVPVSPTPELAVLVVVSPEWQAAYLLPRRSDVVWIMDVLRKGAQGVLCRLRPPLAARPVTYSDQEAIDWRDGDVLFAFPYGQVQTQHRLPVFASCAQVRHAAIWAHDFEVGCPLPLVVWRPGVKPVNTTMPPPSRWHADLQAFSGHFQRKYPGQWVPVVWAYDDRVHLCQRLADPQMRNVIVETPTATKLLGVCYTVPEWTTRTSLARSLGLEPAFLTLLGHPGEPEPGPPRDGDILHYSGIAPDVVDRSGAAERTAYPALSVFILTLFHAHCRPALLLAALCALARPIAGVGILEEPSLDDVPQHWIWSPFRGGVGPFAFKGGIPQGFPTAEPCGRPDWCPCSRLWKPHQENIGCRAHRPSTSPWC